MNLRRTSVAQIAALKCRRTGEGLKPYTARDTTRRAGDIGISVPSLVRQVL